MDNTIDNELRQAKCQELQKQILDEKRKYQLSRYEPRSSGDPFNNACHRITLIITEILDDELLIKEMCSSFSLFNMLYDGVTVNLSISNFWLDLSLQERKQKIISDLSYRLTYNLLTN